MVKLTDWRTGLPVYLSGSPKSITPVEPINYPVKENFDKTPYTVVRLDGSRGLFGDTDIVVSVKESSDEVKAAFDASLKNEAVEADKPLGGTDETTIQEYRELVAELNEEIYELEQEVAELEEELEDYIDADAYDDNINVEYYVSRKNRKSDSDSLNSKVRTLIDWFKNG